MPITHAKVSAISDSGSASLIQPSDWNAGHVGSIGSTRQSVTRTSGNFVLAASQTTSVELSSTLRLTIAASVGDVLAITFNGMAHSAASAEGAYDSATVVSGALLNQCSPGTRPCGHGYFTNVAVAVTGTIWYVVQAGDIVAGFVTVTVTYQNTGAVGVGYADATYGLRYTVLNFGHL